MGRKVRKLNRSKHKIALKLGFSIISITLVWFFERGKKKKGK